MTEVNCTVCENEEHKVSTGIGELTDVIEVDGKYFCPNTYDRILSEEEAEEMTEAQIDEAYSETLVLERSAKYKIVKKPKEEKKKA